MSATFEDLRILKAAEEIADGIWQEVSEWNGFAKNTVGEQLVRAVDSIGANIAESFGRFHFGEKLQFLYYARGSLFETKYWLNRALKRDLLPQDNAQKHIAQLTNLVRQLNAFAGGLKAHRKEAAKKPSSVRESGIGYNVSSDDAILQDLIASNTTLFTPTEIEWLQTLPNATK